MIDFSKPPAKPQPEQWTLEEALKLVREIHQHCPDLGYHVALTGGLLYKDGPRKDLDLIFYHIREGDQRSGAISTEMLGELEWKIKGFSISSDFGFVVKCYYNGKRIDCMFPEEEVGGYSGATMDQEP
jgi:hypothetical protein